MLINVISPQCWTCVNKIRVRMVERVVTSKEDTLAVVPHSGPARIAIKVNIEI